MCKSVLNYYVLLRYHLLTHVKTKHNMTISAYNKAHMQLHNVEYGDSNIMDKGRKIGTQKAPQWCDGTMYKCPYCFNIYYRYFTFRIHLINSHKMTDTEERSICVRENEILTDIYRCKICSTQVKRDRMDIEAHLKQAHKTTLKIYSANFENPSVQESNQAIVSKLVRMGVLEEPSKSVCRTPKKLKTTKPSDNRNDNRVPHHENLNKFVSVSENVPLEKMTHVDVKSEFDEPTYLNNPYQPPVDDMENDLTRKRKRKLPSKLSSDFEVSQVRSLTPDRAETKAKKMSEGGQTSSSPLAQRNINTMNNGAVNSVGNGVTIKSDPDAPPPRSSGKYSASEMVNFITNKKLFSGDEAVMYKCPIAGCEWTCGKEGMRQGPAVLHLLKVHKIQPLQMRERGIKFDKIESKK